MNGFDRAILLFFNRPAFHTPALDQFTIKLADNLLFKGGIVLAVIWALWFSKPARVITKLGGKLIDPDERVNQIRRTILIGFAGTFIALLVTRGASVMFPSRQRPLNFPQLFTIPATLDTSKTNFFVTDNSFPSDHAGLFYALATMIFLVSPRMGTATFIYVSIVILLPRMYLLLHYPSDIIAGGIVGSSCVLLAWIAGTATAAGRALVSRVFSWSITHAPSFYAAMFLWSFSVAELFDSIRKVARIGPVLKSLVVHH